MSAATTVYGYSDDNVACAGEIEDEYGCYGTDDDERGVLLAFSDGTVLEVKYGKGGQAIWAVTLLKRGSLFLGIEQCTDEDADPYSDVAKFGTGLTWCYAAKEWEPLHAKPPAPPRQSGLGDTGAEAGES